MSRYVVGIDGGGSWTRAVLLDDDGTEIARADGGPAVADAANPENAANSVRRVMEAVALEGRVTFPVRALWAGLSGAGREASRSAVELEVGRMGLADVVHVTTDVSVAFHDAFADGPGILLIAGTGSIAWGRADDGREGRVGGWGHHIGDEGSGYAIGVEALRRVARHADGRAPETTLERALVSHLGVASVDGIVSWASSAPRAEVAALVPVVAAAASAGDAVAGEVLAHAVDELEGHVLTILTNLGPWERPPELALAGGLLRPGGVLRDPLEKALARHRLSPMTRTLDPARGAARLALANLS